MNAVIYARYSSDSQREESIDDQIKECMNYADRTGLTVISTYTDKALTGKTDKRPGFLRMIDDSKKGIFSYVICYKTDRFCRSRKDAAKYKSILKENGVNVVYAKMDIPKGPEGIILEGVMEALDEYYSANLSQNIKRGQLGNAIKCKSNGVNVFGYKRDDNDMYVVDDREAEAVKKVFEFVCDSYPDTYIINWLNENGYRNTLGKKFTKTSINRIIRNRKYIGEYKFGDVLVKDGMPAIINENTFTKANEMKNKRRSRRVINNEYLLTDILYCGECGCGMFGKSGTSRNKTKHYYYSCSNRIKHTCDMPYIQKDVIENAIINILNRLLFDDAVLSDLTDMIYEAINKKDNYLLDQLESEYDEKTKQLENIVDAIADGAYTKSMIARMKELEKELESLDTSIAKEKLKNKPIEKDFITFILHKFKTNELSSNEQKKRLINTFVSKAFIYKNGKLVLMFNYKKDGEIASYSEILEHISTKSPVLQISSGGVKNTQFEHSINISLINSCITVYTDIMH